MITGRPPSSSRRTVRRQEPSVAAPVVVMRMDSVFDDPRRRRVARVDPGLVGPSRGNVAQSVEGSVAVAEVGDHAEQLANVQQWHPFLPVLIEWAYLLIGRPESVRDLPGAPEHAQAGFGPAVPAGRVHQPRAPAGSGRSDDVCPPQITMQQRRRLSRHNYGEATREVLDASPIRGGQRLERMRFVQVAEDPVFGEEHVSVGVGAPGVALRKEPEIVRRPDAELLDPTW